ncbi:MAG: hypothetical protein LBM06_08020 [Prevotellaceae bacterium]|nr:hypothetical protein [Prevotellaceae bacterium]
MPTNDHQLRNYSDELSRLYGTPGTPERTKFDEEAYSFYCMQVLSQSAKEKRYKKI